jgi:uncharacterized protein YecE (DUF72 family)
MGHELGEGRVKSARPSASRLAPRAPGQIRVGTSGWLYPRWRGDFYPRGLRHADELAHLAQRLNSVEVNGTFYSLTRPATCTAWRRMTPPGFVFAVKGSRYITHMLKLRNFEHPVANFFASGILRLGSQLGPILWQLPPQLPFDRERALRFFTALPRDLAGAERWARRHDERTKGRAALRAPDGRQAPLRHAVEVRHPSWLEEQALATLRELDVALVAADTAGRHPLSRERTADFAYVRLHGATALYASQYTDAELRRWAGLIQGWAAAGDDVYVYFDNDALGHAPHDATRLAKLISTAGEVSGRQPLFRVGTPT